MKNHGVKIELRQESGITVAALLDEEILDEGTIGAIAESLFQVVQEGGAVQMVLSFARVKHLSSMALGTLIRLNKRVEEAGGKLKLCEIRPSLYEVFVITRLNKLFEIYDTEEMAIVSFSA